MKKRLYVILVMFLFTLTIQAQDKNEYTNEPGYVDFGEISSFHVGDDMTEVYLDKSLLTMVANLSGDKSELKDVLGGLKLIRVNSFEVPKNIRANLRKKISEIDKNLKSKKWNRILKVKNNEEYTNVYIKSSADSKKIEGMVIISLDKKGQASFINIVGQVNLNQLGKLGNEFNIPGLLQKHHKNKNKKDDKK